MGVSSHPDFKQDMRSPDHDLTLSVDIGINLLREMIEMALAQYLRRCSPSTSEVAK
jgi:hypothetical protein